MASCFLLCKRTLPTWFMTACLIDGMRMHRICLVGRRPHTKGIASLCLLGVLCTAVPAAAQTMPEPVRLALKKAGIPHDAVALAAAPVVPDGAPRVRVGADRPVNPASVMKLVTTYAALDVLGPTFTWHTQFLADGAASDGLLRGNLYVRGGGDPKFVMERIAVALQAVRDAGISVVHGDMVLDQSAFQLPRVDPSAFDGERLRPYNASPEALLINFKSVILKVTPDPRRGGGPHCTRATAGRSGRGHHCAIGHGPLCRLANRFASAVRSTHGHSHGWQISRCLWATGMAGGLCRPRFLCRTRAGGHVASQWWPADGAGTYRSRFSYSQASSRCAVTAVGRYRG
jgi:hypothetical protein